MAAKKFLRLVSGRLQEIVATVTSAGAANDGDIVALDSTGKLDTSVMPVGFGSDANTRVASEALSAGDIVDIWNDAGTEKARKADATAAGKEGVGFVLAGVTLGGNATVYYEGTITGLTGLTPGARYYLDASTPGAVTATPPSGSGNVVQYIGRATSATEISFEPSEGVVLA